MNLKLKSNNRQLSFNIPFLILYPNPLKKYMKRADAKASALKDTGAILLPLATINNAGSSRIASDIDAGTHHIENPVNTGYQGKALKWQANGLKNHCQHDETGSRDTGRTDGSKGTRKDDHHHLIHGEINAENIGDEKGADTHINGRAIHVDSCSQRKNETGHLTGNPQLLLSVFHVDRKRRRGGAGGKATSICSEAPLKNFAGLIFASALTRPLYTTVV